MAALVLARLAKEETPEEVGQLLFRVTVQAPPALDVYLRLPCGRKYPWSAALWALSNLGPTRLMPLAPLLEKHLHEIRNAYVLEQDLFVRLLLFIVFEEKPAYDHQPRPAEALTEQQRHILLMLLKQDRLWHDGNFSGLLKAYGLPGKRQEMAAYLGQEWAPSATEVTKTYVAEQLHRARFQAYGALIQAVYPELATSWGGRVQGEDGQEDDILTDHRSDLLFRFPRRMDAVEAMEREGALLRALQGCLPLPIPNPVYASQGVHEVGRAFMGHVKLPGRPLYKEMLECIDGEERVQKLADQLASFLYALHHIPVAYLAHLSLPEAPQREALGVLYRRACEELFPHMARDRRVQITAQFETFLDTPEHFSVTPALVHGNFGPETILYSAKEHGISGVIDFSRACLGDPSLDFARLVGPGGYGKDFLQRWVPAYPDIPALLERAHFYAEVFELEEAFRKRSKQESNASTASPFPEMDRFFDESPKLSAGEEETPIG